MTTSAVGSHSNTTKEPLRKDITGLRAIAVLFVVLFHFQIAYLNGGYIGVDVFFVISGYLMTSIILGRMDRGRFSVLSFYFDRATRIIPPLMVMILVTLMFGWFFIDPIEYTQMGKSALSSILLISNFQYMAESGYFAEAAEKIWFLHTWSLSVEWQFYIIYPLALMLIVRFSKRYLTPIIIISTVLILAVTGVAQSIGGPRLSSAIFYMTPTRSPEMLLGGIVYLLQDRLSLLRNRSTEIVGLAAICLSVLIFEPHTLWPGFNWLLPALGAAAVIAANQSQTSIFAAEPVQKIGLWSYSIYLWHWPIVVGMRYYEFHGTLPSIVGIAASVGAGFLSFRYVEIPTKNYLRSHGQIVQLGGLVAFVLIAVGAYGVWSSSGVLSRMNSEQAIAVALDSSEARNDWAFPAACQFVQGAPTAACWTGQGDGPLTVIFGDSHAQMLYPYFAQHAQRALFVTNAGCPILPDTLRQDRKDCVSWRAAAIAYLGSLKFDKLIYTALWRDQLTDNGAGDTSCLSTGTTCAKTSPTEAKSILAASFAREISAFRARDIKVYILDRFPVSPYSVPDMLVKTLFEGRPIDGKFPYQPLPQDGAIATALQAAVGAGAEIVPTKQIACDGTDVCHALSDKGFSNYKDSNHLRPNFIAGHLGDVLAPTD